MLGRFGIPFCVPLLVFCIPFMMKHIFTQTCSELHMWRHKLYQLLSDISPKPRTSIQK